MCDCSSGLQGEYNLYPPSKCCLTHGVATRILQRMSTTVSNSSLCLALFSQCSTAVLSAHAQTDWERAPASLSSVEMLTACITDTTTSQSRVCTVGKKKSYSWQLNMNSFVAIWKVDKSTFATTRVESVTFSLQSFRLSQGHAASHKPFFSTVHCRMNTVDAAL